LGFISNDSLSNPIAIAKKEKTTAVLLSPSL